MTPRSRTFRMSVERVAESQLVMRRRFSTRLSRAEGSREKSDALALRVSCPVGACENSPVIYRWGSGIWQSTLSPVGTDE